MIGTQHTVTSDTAGLFDSGYVNPRQIRPGIPSSRRVSLPLRHPHLHDWHNRRHTVMRVLPCLPLLLALSFPVKEPRSRSRKRSTRRPFPRRISLSLTSITGPSTCMTRGEGGRSFVSVSPLQRLCPFVAMKLMEASRLLGRDTTRVVLVLVTTDPGRDTPPVLAAYSNVLGMLDSWHFVTGPLPSMRRVWKDYFISVETAPGFPARIPQARQPPLPRTPKRQPP